MKVKTLKRSGFGSNMGYITRKSKKKCLNWSVVVKLLQKKAKCKSETVLILFLELSTI